MGKDIPGYGLHFIRRCDDHNLAWGTNWLVTMKPATTGDTRLTLVLTMRDEGRPVLTTNQGIFNKPVLRKGRWSGYTNPLTMTVNSTTNPRRLTLLQPIAMIMGRVKFCAVKRRIKPISASLDGMKAGKTQKNRIPPKPQWSVT